MKPSDSALNSWDITASVQENTATTVIIHQMSNCSGYDDCMSCAPVSDQKTMDPLGKHVDTLTQLLAATELRQQVIGHNIANVNTPNFRRLEVSFEEQLTRQLKQTSTESKTSTVSPKIQETPGLSTRTDGNNVDLDREIGQMNKNAMLQQTFLQILGVEMGMMRRAISG